MAISEAELERANLRMAARRAGPVAVGAHYDPVRDRIVVQLSTGLELAFAPRAVQGLGSASPTDLTRIEITPSGLGLHWPELDADLYLPALLEGMLGTKRWMAARLGAAGGRARSMAKAAASRNNGKRGGRPRRSPATA